MTKAEAWLVTDSGEKFWLVIPPGSTRDGAVLIYRRDYDVPPADSPDVDARRLTDEEVAELVFPDEDGDRTSMADCLSNFDKEAFDAMEGYVVADTVGP